MPTRSPSIERVVSALSALGIVTEVRELPDSTRSAVDAAQAIGCDVAQIVKSIILRGKDTNRSILVITSGVNRVSERRIAGELNELVEKADATFVREQTGFSIGGVPPIGHTVAPTVFLDQTLLSFASVWAAAGTPHAVFCVSPSDLLRVTSGMLVSFSQGSSS